MAPRTGFAHCDETNPETSPQQAPGDAFPLETFADISETGGKDKLMRPTLKAMMKQTNATR
jgi:hypothetical protein